MTPHEFITKWQRSELSERSACQQHFLDACELPGQPSGIGTVRYGRLVPGDAPSARELKKERTFSPTSTTPAPHGSP